MNHLTASWAVLAEKAYPWVHVTPTRNRTAIEQEGLRRGVRRNYNTDPRNIYLASDEASALRWAKEIANQRGEAETYSIFAVNLDGIPIGSWGGVGKTKFGPQAVVRDWDIPAANIKWLNDVEVKPRKGARTFE